MCVSMYIICVDSFVGQYIFIQYIYNIVFICSCVITLHDGVGFGGVYVVWWSICNFTLTLNIHFGMGPCTL